MLDQSTVEFVLFIVAVMMVFFFLPWLAMKVSKLYPRDPFNFDKKMKQYDKFSF